MTWLPEPIHLDGSTWPPEPKSRRFDLAAGADKSTTGADKSRQVDLAARADTSRQVDLAVRVIHLDGLTLPLELIHIDWWT